jgi:uncharacterized membrane protein YkvA (DUF1232 family)
MSRLQARRRMKNLLMFLPNTIVLCGRLMVDERVPRTEKLLFAGAIVYAVMPFDFIPDMLPFIGQVDDAYLIALTLLRLINRTDARIVREHWRGGGDIVQLAEAIAGIAPKLLPARVERVLSAQVESEPTGRDEMRSREASLVELPVARDET